MIKAFNIRNIGGWDADTETGNPQSTLQPLFAIDYLNEKGFIVVTSATHNNYRTAEEAANSRLEELRNRG